MGVRGHVQVATCAIIMMSNDTIICARHMQETQAYIFRSPRSAINSAVCLVHAPPISSAQFITSIGPYLAALLHILYGIASFARKKLSTSRCPFRTAIQQTCESREEQKGLLIQINKKYHHVFSIRCRKKKLPQSKLTFSCLRFLACTRILQFYNNFTALRKA